MTWNYRIVKHRSRRATWYGLHEVYYNSRGKMYLWAADPDVQGDTVKEIISTLASMLRDATREAPILQKSLMPGEKGAKK